MLFLCQMCVNPVLKRAFACKLGHMLDTEATIRYDRDACGSDEASQCNPPFRVAGLEAQSGPAILCQEEADENQSPSAFHCLSRGTHSGIPRIEEEKMSRPRRVLSPPPDGLNVI